MSNKSIDNRTWVKAGGWLREPVKVKLACEKQPEQSGFELPLIGQASPWFSWLVSGLVLLMLQFKPAQAQLTPDNSGAENLEQPDFSQPAVNPVSILPSDCPPVAEFSREADLIKVNLLPSSHNQYMAHTNVYTNQPHTNVAQVSPWPNYSITPHANSNWTNHSNYVTPHTNFAPGDVIY